MTQSDCPITVWLRRLPKSTTGTKPQWFVNHWEYGHLRRTSPNGSSLQLKLWASSEWKPVHTTERELRRRGSGLIDFIYNGYQKGV